MKHGYKRTKIGTIPNDWDVVSFDDQFSISAGGDVNVRLSVEEQDDVHSFPIYSNALINGGLFGYCSYADHPAGSITITARGKLGFAAYRNHEYTAIGRVLVLEPRHETSGLFFAEFINNRVRFAVESTGVPQLTAPQIGRYLLAVPPYLEQRAIAAALSDMDALLDGLDRLIAKKRDLKRAAMQQLLTGRTRLPGFNGQWNLFFMARDSVLKSRIGWQGLTTNEYLTSGEYYLVTGTDFFSGGVNWANCHFVDNFRYSQDQNIQLSFGDVLLTKDGTIGKVAYIESLPGPACLNSGVFVIRPKAGSFHQLFMYYILVSPIFGEFLRRLQAGSTISHLYQKDFTQFTFDIPSIAEQAEIAAVLADMDSEIAALEARRDKTRDLKQAMMQELLTGKTRLVQPEVGRA